MSGLRLMAQWIVKLGVDKEMLLNSTHSHRVGVGGLTFGAITSFSISNLSFFLLYDILTFQRSLVFVSFNFAANGGATLPPRAPGNRPAAVFLDGY